MRCACCNSIQTQVEQKVFKDLCNECYELSRRPDDSSKDFDLEFVIDYIIHNGYIQHEQVYKDQPAVP